MTIETMRLRPRQGPGIYLDIDVENRLAAKIRALTPSQRLALSMRAPAELERVVDGLAHLAELTPFELQQRFTHARRDVEALAAERRRRGQCESCGVHRDQGHVLGCDRAEAAAHERLKSEGLGPDGEPLA